MKEIKVLAYYSVDIRKAISLGALAVPAIEEADVWPSCEHDHGHGVCEKCEGTDVVQYVHRDEGKQYCAHDEMSEAVDHCS